MNYTAEQIRQAGIEGEISSIDIEHLINLLNRLHNEPDSKKVFDWSKREEPEPTSEHFMG